MKQNFFSDIGQQIIGDILPEADSGVGHKEKESNQTETRCLAEVGGGS